MKSTSFKRGTIKKKTTAALNQDDDDNIGNHLSADSDSDENYDDVRIEHFETTFEKSLAPPKRARILGGGSSSTRKQRGTFGAGMKHKASLFGTYKATTTTPIIRSKVDGANPATAALLQQQHSGGRRTACIRRLRVFVRAGRLAWPARDFIAV